MSLSLSVATRSQLPIADTPHLQANESSTASEVLTSVRSTSKTPSYRFFRTSSSAPSTAAPALGFAINDPLRRSRTRYMKLLRRRIRNAIRKPTERSSGGLLADSFSSFSGPSVRPVINCASCTHIAVHQQPRMEYTAQMLNLRGGSENSGLEEMSSTGLRGGKLFEDRKRKRAISPARLPIRSPWNFNNPNGTSHRSTSNTKHYCAFNEGPDILPSNGKLIAGEPSFEQAMNGEDAEMGYNPEYGWKEHFEGQSTYGGRVDEPVVVTLVGNEDLEGMDEAESDAVTLEHQVCSRFRRRRRDSGFSMTDCPYSIIDPRLRGGDMLDVQTSQILPDCMKVFPDQYEDTTRHTATSLHDYESNDPSTNLQQKDGSYGILSIVDSTSNQNPWSQMSGQRKPHRLEEREDTTTFLFPQDLFDDVPLTKRNTSGAFDRMDVLPSDFDLQVPFHDEVSNESEDATEIPEPGPEPYSPICVDGDWGRWANAERGPYGTDTL